MRRVLMMRSLSQNSFKSISKKLNHKIDEKVTMEVYDNRKIILRR